MAKTVPLTFNKRVLPLLKGVSPIVIYGPDFTYKDAHIEALALQELPPAAAPHNLSDYLYKMEYTGCDSTLISQKELIEQLLSSEKALQDAPCFLQIETSAQNFPALCVFLESLLEEAPPTSSYSSSTPHLFWYIKVDSDYIQNLAVSPFLTVRVSPKDVTTLVDSPAYQQTTIPHDVLQKCLLASEGLPELLDKLIATASHPYKEGKAIFEKIYRGSYTEILNSTRYPIKFYEGLMTELLIFFSQFILKNATVLDKLEMSSLYRLLKQAQYQLRQGNDPGSLNMSHLILKLNKIVTTDAAKRKKLFT